MELGYYYALKSKNVYNEYVKRMHEMNQLEQFFIWVEKTKWLRFVTYGVVLLLVLHFLRSWYHIVTTTAPDFGVYYTAGKYLLSGQALYGRNVGFTAFSYPPQTALAYIPLSLLPYSIAQLLFVSLSGAMILAIPYLLSRLFSIKLSFLRMEILTSFVFLFFPTRFTLGMGQINLISLAILLSGLVFMQEKQSKIGGILIGISILLKPQTIVLLLPMIIKREWKTVGSALVFLTSITAVFVAFFGVGYMEQYLRIAVPQLMAFSGRGIYYNQSISSFVFRFLPNENGAFLSQILQLGIAFFGVYCLWKRTYTAAIATVLFIPFFLLFQPITWQHHIVYIIPSILYLFTVIKSKKYMYLLAISTVLLLVNIPAFTIASFSPLYALFISHGVIGLIGVSLTVVFGLSE